MQLRGKLFLYFILLVMLTLAVFGVSAYQIAYKSALSKEQVLLESMVNSHAQRIANEYKSNGSYEHILLHLRNSHAEDHVWLLIDKGNSVIFPEHITPIFSGDMLRFPIKKIIKGSDASGHHEVGGKTYVWAVARLGELGYKILHVYSSGYNINSNFTGLASRLLVSAIIIMWIAVWVALIIATNFTRKINRQSEEIEYQASHDMVTGLPNREYLNRKLADAIGKGGVDSIAVIVMDMNRLREINDTLGHDFGDSLLRVLGERLTSEFWEKDAIARLGGDEFALMLPMAARADVEVVLRKIRDVLSVSIEIQDISLEVDVSMGVAIYPDDGDDSLTLLKHAEVAMYNAKSAGTLCEYYKLEGDPHSIERLMLMGDLLHAIEKEEFVLYYQPKIDLLSNKIVGVEALLRWMNMKRGVISPDNFIPLAEQGSSIKYITHWVLDNAVSQCALWQRNGLSIKISVNLSARLLIDVDVVGAVKQCLDKHALDPSFLVLEITETAIMLDPARAMETMQQLNELGVVLSIDDFGTGYTSISQLKDLPVHEIKIDKSFVINMLENAGDELTVKSIIDLAHTMGYLVVAEGVETEAVMRGLIDKGCDLAQGFYLGKPMPIAAFDRSLEQKRWKLA